MSVMLCSVGANGKKVASARFFGQKQKLYIFGDFRTLQKN